MTKYTECASYALKKAYDAAKKLSASSIGTEHLLIGLASGKGTAARILDNNGLVTDRLLAIVETATRVEGTVAVKDKGNYTPRALKVLDRAAAEAQKFKSKEIGTEHIIIAMIKEYDFEQSETNLNSMSEAQNFIDWMQQQDLISNYPQLGDNCAVEEIAVSDTVPTVWVNQADNLAKYQVNCTIKYLEQKG